ncbi:ATP-binding protein [Rhizobium sp. BR 315]|uniref:ATP-binding protein n=1 Tax=Rhizobium sp. BR 315 TaxID=3040014 RepID=UPI003D35969E
MKFDVLGRINNMRLPDGKTALLYSVYEAVSNSIHAINDRFGEEKAATRGRVSVDITLDADGDVSQIAISDNGIGFTEDNLESFETSDSRFKYKRGGKGVGRFIWIKMFQTIRVESVVKNGRAKERISFRFAPEKPNSIAYKRTSPAPDSDLGSTITLSKLRREQRGKVRPSSYLKDLALHFFPQFISKTLPQITINYDGETSSLNEYIAGKVDEPTTEIVNFDFGEGPSEITISHLFVDNSISTNLRNSYLLTAHGRLVGDPVSIERKYALKELPDGKSYVAVVSGDFLDERVDQERLGFKFTNHQGEVLEDIVLAAAERFLIDHIKKLRSRQKVTVESLVFEHPQLATQFENIDEYVNSLGPGMDEEQIAQNLFVLLFRDERDLRKKIDELDSLESLDEEAKSQARETLADIQNQERARLAELVVKRHQLLQMANVMLKFKDEEARSYHYEKVVHDIICPMGEMYRSGDHTRHNLWMIDDALGSYQFFASDKSIKSLADGAGSRKEPDLIFFNPLGFRREGLAEPVVIIEFKRPGDDKPSQDPVRQVLGYIEQLRGSRVTDVDGGIISDISRDTPFECIIVCELTPATRELFESSLAQSPTPDGQGYFGWSKPHNAHLRVMTFAKMLRDAELRNQVFFDQLKLGSPSVAAKKRAARLRERRRVADA